MIHFFYLLFYALLVSIAFAVFADGTNRDKFLYGLKTFGQFLGISIILAWVFYFIPW